MVTAPLFPSSPRPSPRFCRAPGLRELRGCGLAADAMYRLLSTVTARAATPGSWACGRGQRAAHHRAGLPPLGPGWVGGLGLGLGLALGVKLAGGLRGAPPAQSPGAPDLEALPQAESLPSQEQPLAQWSPQIPMPSPTRRFARAIDSSRDLLHRIKVWRQGRTLPPRTRPFTTGVTSEWGALVVISWARVDPTPGGGMLAVGFREGLPVPRPPGHGQELLGVVQVGAEVTSPASGTAP